MNSKIQELIKLYTTRFWDHDFFRIMINFKIGCIICFFDIDKYQRFINTAYARSINYLEFNIMGSNTFLLVENWYE